MLAGIKQSIRGFGQRFRQSSDPHHRSKCDHAQKCIDPQEQLEHWVMVIVAELAALGMLFPFVLGLVRNLARSEVNDRGRKGMSESAPCNDEHGT